MAFKIGSRVELCGPLLIGGFAEHGLKDVRCAGVDFDTVIFFFSLRLGLWCTAMLKSMAGRSTAVRLVLHR